VHDGGFLTGEICVRRSDDFDLHRVDASTPSSMNGSTNAFDLALRHVEYYPIRFERCRGEGCPVEH
jgi:hypothetical protein